MIKLDTTISMVYTNDHKIRIQMKTKMIEGMANLIFPMKASLWSPGHRLTLFTALPHEELVLVPLHPPFYDR